MFIDTRAIGFPLTDAILRHVEAKLESNLGPFGRWIVRVTVRLEDVNADRGGADKRCSIVAALRRQAVVVAEATRADLYAAIDEAAERARSAVLKTVKRQLRLQRRLARPRPGQSARGSTAKTGAAGSDPLVPLPAATR